MPGSNFSVVNEFNNVFCFIFQIIIHFGSPSERIINQALMGIQERVIQPINNFLFNMFTEEDV